MIKILAVGKMKDKRLGGLVDDFVKRIRPLSAVEIVELKDAGPEREGADMATRLGSAAGSQFVVAMDENGVAMTSRELSELLGKRGNLAFLIGGADGLGPDVRPRADLTLRLSRLTLTHEMARLVLIEQIYRGLTILRGMPYHRD